MKILKHKKLEESSEFPAEFDPVIYKKFNPDLDGLNNVQLKKHYNKFGRNEGRMCSIIHNGTGFVRQINTQERYSLEIGPLDKPKLECSKTYIKTLDHLSREELVEKYKNDNSVESDKIVEVDYVWKGEPFKQIIPIKFDNVLASHVIEHSADLIGFIHNISDILNSKGYLFLIVPDKRFCFDHFREETVLMEIVYAHKYQFTKPTLDNVLDMRRAKTHNDAVKHWAGEHGQKETEKFLNDYSLSYDQQIKILNDLTNKYVDSHVWKFTPTSFEKIIKYLFREKIIDLELKRIYHTIKNTQQFFAILQKY